MEPVVSVLVVSDFASGKAEGWRDLRATLAGLARQDFQEAAEFLLIESEQIAAHMPPDIPASLPGLRVVSARAHVANALKNVGARAASAQFIALLDGDCVPDPGWLRHLVAALRAHPQVATVTGRTQYAGGGFFDRVMGMIARSYLDEGQTAPTRHIAINNAGYRRDVLLDHPLPETGAAHMSLLHAEALRRDGAQFLFEPGMRVEHAYGGWAHEKQIRRSIGYGVIRTRQMDAHIPYASLAHLGYLSVPLFLVLRTLHTCWICVTRRHVYAVSWYQLPVTFALAAAACAMEASGMLRAVRHLPPPETEFR